MREDRLFSFVARTNARLIFNIMGYVALETSERFPASNFASKVDYSGCSPSAYSCSIAYHTRFLTLWASRKKFARTLAFSLSKDSWDMIISAKVGRFLSYPIEVTFGPPCDESLAVPPQPCSVTQEWRLIINNAIPQSLLTHEGRQVSTCRRY